MSRRAYEDLGELQQAVLEVVWTVGEATVNQVKSKLSRRKLAYTTILSVMQKLDRAGWLTHREEGRAYVYRAAEPARSLAARAVRQIIDGLCKGSVEELVSGMVEAKVLSRGEMDRLEEFVRANRRGDK